MVTGDDAIYRLPDLRYDYSALEPHISGRIMELHHAKHHAAYVTGANTAIDRLQEARGSSDFTVLSMLEKNLAFNLSGHVLHSLWWEASPRTRAESRRGGWPSSSMSTSGASPRSGPT